MQRLRYMDKYSGSQNFLQTLKLTLVPVVVVYLFIQMIITANTSGIYFGIHQSRRQSFGRQLFQENITSVSFVTKPFNGSIQEGNYIKLSRALVTKTRYNVQSTCSSNVRMLRGYQRQTKGFLTLGLSTVPREGAYYLPKTLRSLISQMSENEKSECVIVIFLGSHNTTWVDKTLSMIDSEFTESVSAGLIQIIQPDESIYPNFNTITKRNYNDTPLRVHWRTKQNIDYAYLFAYCEKLSEYYIHMEDDITAAKGYIKEIKTLLSKTENSKQTWFLIEFSSLGFIGKLFRSSDMCTMKTYFLLFKEEKPCDLLINDLKSIKTQSKVFKNPKSLFQHFGISSSLKGKVQKLTDKNFKDAPKQQNMPSLRKGHSDKGSSDLSNNFKSNKTQNPRGSVLTSMTAYTSFTALRPYDVKLGGYFWAKTPNVSDYYRIIFEQPISINLVYIRTGHPITKIDQLENAVVKVGYNTENNKCENNTDIGSFKDGIFLKKPSQPLSLVSCLEILITKSQKSWMIIYEIHIETADTKRK